MTDAAFEYPTDRFQQLVRDALQHARTLGATEAAAEASEGYGLSVSVRHRELETVERNRDKSLAVTVYLGQRRGHAVTSDFSQAALRQTVEAAYDIARFTAQDPEAGLPDAQDIAQETPELDLMHAWLISPEDAAALARRAEDSALGTSELVTNSEGASVSAQHSHFWSAHMRQGALDGPGVFAGGYASSRHGLSVAVIAGQGDSMQRDGWYNSMRNPAQLASPEAVGRYAAERALARVGATKMATVECPVLFEAPLAAGLLGSLVHALSGTSLYRRTTFLPDSMGQQVLAPHLQVDEDPFVARGKGSVPFDDEGVRVAPRQVIGDGRVQGYFLSTYSARKLGLRTTGNAGGSHNLVWHSRLTQPDDDLPSMLRKLHRGLLVTELMGQGVNPITGDYSRGAAGYWVENGHIAYPVQEITIAGNLRDMLMQVVAIGADVYTMGAKSTGSVLIERMKVAGS
jgi:PmbA protein